MKILVANVRLTRKSMSSSGSRTPPNVSVEHHKTPESRDTQIRRHFAIRNEASRQAEDWREKVKESEK